ncbi:MAG: helix-turn-helix domain-containing protein [Pseudomonadota bacterium]
MVKEKRRETDTAKTRQKIVAATDQLISESGLSATSVSAVARSLGMSHGNVYRHFASRDDLLVAVAETWMRETRQASEGSIDKTATPAQNLESLVMAIRAELLRRANNVAALDLYHYALEKMSDAAHAHHRHRADLVSEITGDPDRTPQILDALRAFTDPTLLLATESPDTRLRVRAVCELICK